MSKRIPWDDQWLYDNVDLYDNFAVLRLAYNAVHKVHVDDPVTFKNHMYKKLGLYSKKHFERYTEEQNAFLRLYYPILNEVDLETKYNNEFGATKTYQQLQIHCVSLGIHKTKEYKTNCGINNGHGRYVPIGTIITEADGRERIKVAEHKWMRLGAYTYKYIYHKEIPKGYMVIYLNGDDHDYSEENLMAVPRNYNGLLSKNLKLEDRSNRDITKAAIKWCDLYTLVKKEINDEA